MSCRTVRPGNQGQGKHLGLIRLLALHGDHGTQLGQWKQSFGHKLISDIWIIIPAEMHYNQQAFSQTALLGNDGAYFNTTYTVFMIFFIESNIIM